MPFRQKKKKKKNNIVCVIVKCAKKMTKKLFTFSTSALTPLNGIKQNLSGSKISISYTKIVFLVRSEKQDGHRSIWLILAGIFSTSPLKLLNRIQLNLTGSKISTSSTSSVLLLLFFCCCCCCCFFFLPIEKKDGHPASDWLRHFQLLLLSCWTGFYETRLDARSHRLLKNVCFFSGRTDKQDGRPASDWPRHFRLLL